MFAPRTLRTICSGHIFEIDLVFAAFLSTVKLRKMNLFFSDLLERNYWRQVWWTSYGFAKNIFPHIQRTYFDVFFPLNRLVHSVLLPESVFRVKNWLIPFWTPNNCKKFMRIKVPVKKYTFQKICAHTFFWHL